MPEASAKDIRVEPISAAVANALVRRVHYSGKIAPNSQLHLGVYLNGMLEGAMQFGPSMDKRKVIGLVRDTGWNGFLELNRMAFGPALPRNSESRALGVAMRMIRKAYPHVEWIISFADGTQCGDGTIYRAAGFVLTKIGKNSTIWDIGGIIVPDTSVRAGIGGTNERRRVMANMTLTKGKHILETGASSMKQFKEAGAKVLEGFQLRYIYFLNPAARARLTVPEIPFSEIDKAGARMYLGRRADSSAVERSGAGAAPLEPGKNPAKKATGSNPVQHQSKGDAACPPASTSSAASSIASPAKGSAGRKPNATRAAKQRSAPAGGAKVSAGEACDGPSKGTATGQRRSTRSKSKKGKS
jgi:hypothetical protein